MYLAPKARYSHHSLGAAPQDYGNPKTPALKARFTPMVSSMQEYRKPQQELSASIFDGRYV